MTTSMIDRSHLSNRADAVTKRFREVYGISPRGVFRAPGRVNLIGEHTDYNDGFVMPAAIGFYSHAAIGERVDETLSVYSEQFQETVEFSPGQLAGPPHKHWSDYVRGVAAVLQEEGYPWKGAKLVIDGQVPIGAGLSSSAAIEVATAFALTSLGGLTIPLLEVARLCQRAENTYTGARCGIMDQFVSCFGRQDHALMLDCRSLEATYLQLPPNVRLVICNTMVRHELAGGEYNERRASCERVVETIGKFRPEVRALRDLTLEDLEHYRNQISSVDFRRCRHVITENDRVEEAKATIEGADLARFGELMYLSHDSLDRDYEVTCGELNIMVNLARELEGVYGARMTGGGFGGCTINLVESKMVPEFQATVAREYEKLTGLSPQIFVSAAAAGASELLLERQISE
jgi:galactokinase